MARSIRIEYEGAYYHVMARGNRQEKIFLDAEDRQYFLKTVGDVCEMTGWRVHAWVLMSNHYHLFIQTPEANLVAGMKWFQNTYTRRFNVRHKAWGRLFGDRYKAILVEGENSYYYETLLDYIHLNPARAGLIEVKKQSVLDYPWSSIAAEYALSPGKRNSWMACAEGLKSFGFSDTVDGRRKMIEHLDQRAAEEKETAPGKKNNKVTRSWYWGTEKFSEKILSLKETIFSKERSRAYHSAAERRAHGLQQAQILLDEGLIKAKLTKKDLSNLNGSEPRKILLALLIRKKTMVSNAWLAEHLKMRSAANVSRLLANQDMKKICNSLPLDLIKYAKIEN